MSIKEQKRTRLIEKRARALALMVLTRREDLLIEEVTDDIGLDLIIRFHTEGKDGLREFGVQVRGTGTSATKSEADAVLRTSLQELKRYGPFLRPSCLFLFAMANDSGWYTWVAEPIAEDGQALLRRCADPDCRPLDKRGLNEIVDAGDEWYDAIFPRVIVNGPGGSKANRKAAKP